VIKHAVSIAVDRADGTAIGPASWPLGGGPDLRIELIGDIKPRDELGCPICGAPATVPEHVPPEDIGGREMTQTCGPCNHRLGSNVEGELASWFHVELPQARFRSPHFQGARSAGHVLLRSEAAGELVPFVTRSPDRDVDRMLATGGPVRLEGRLPDLDRVWIALLKQSYLSYWLKHGRPVGWLGDQARAALIAARDAEKGAVPASTLAQQMIVGRGPYKPDAAPVVEAIAYEPSGRAIRGAVLVGSLFVSWDFDSRRPAGRPVDRQFSLDFDLGARLDGTVSVVLPARGTST
jgi:hypothetical protein